MGNSGFAAIRRQYEFRSIGIGNWVTADEQQRAAHRFAGALEDLKTILGGPESLVSLRGSLSLEYGIGGQRGVSAHYTPAKRSLSLAKNAGAGSLAHEWFHALDHYLATHAFTNAPPDCFASAAWLKELQPVAHPLNALLFRCFRAILVSEDGSEPSALFRASARMDGQLGTYYYSRPEEMGARAFEAFVQDAPVNSPLLVRGTRQSDEARAGLYPQEPQRTAINLAFGHYFRSLGRALFREFHKTGPGPTPQRQSDAV
ncbi:CLCA_X family protein [Vreelandella utahensis]|uniref:CLCA_X family protein n=1 Tax=Vreelandella halophila TaxID=86177 RepID=UPI000986C923|nr:CLCA_X family protein [Halomonas utahensis]